MRSLVNEFLTYKWLLAAAHGGDSPRWLFALILLALAAFIFLIGPSKWRWERSLRQAFRTKRVGENRVLKVADIAFAGAAALFAVFLLLSYLWAP